MIKRCDWVTGDALYTEYHDMEWGVPLHDDRRLFEFLVNDHTVDCFRYRQIKAHPID
jgi:3-methyladenine DNA glycosylase Tag